VHHEPGRSRISTILDSDGRQNYIAQRGRASVAALGKPSLKSFRYILASFLLAAKLPAQITIAPSLVIQPSSTNLVTVTANIGSRIFPNAVLQMSTDLMTTNWVNVQTNIYIGAGPIVFTDVLATNDIEFFRLEEY
jgi:serine acetyltransferase